MLMLMSVSLSGWMGQGEMARQTVDYDRNMVVSALARIVSPNQSRSAFFHRIEHLFGGNPRRSGSAMRRSTAAPHQK
jgi:hypothetical protein